MTVRRPASDRTASLAETWHRIVYDNKHLQNRFFAVYLADIIRLPKRLIGSAKFKSKGGEFGKRDYFGLSDEPQNPAA